MLQGPEGPVGTRGLRGLQVGNIVIVKYAIIEFVESVFDMWGEGCHSIRFSLHDYLSQNVSR